MKKKEKPSEESFKIKLPSGSDLPKRMERISDLTGLSNYELVQKWLVQEESLLNASSRYYVETMQSKFQESFTEQLRSLLREFRKADKPAGKPETEKKTKPEKSKDYRQTLSQKIQKLRDEGMSFVKIAERFNQEGVSTLSGSGKWYASSVFQLLAK
jgi:hypothetical protein